MVQTDRGAVDWDSDIEGREVGRFGGEGGWSDVASLFTRRSWISYGGIAAQRVEVSVKILLPLPHTSNNAEVGFIKVHYLPRYTLNIDLIAMIDTPTVREVLQYINTPCFQ